MMPPGACNDKESDMSSSTAAAESVELVLQDDAMKAVAEIASLLGGEAGEAEALQRALGTELYLLQQIRQNGAKVFLHFRGGVKAEVDLTG
jgi:hypothetical protein